MMRATFASLGIFLSAQAFAWEAYEFDVTYVNVVNGSSKYCEVGMANLGPKQSGDVAICDNPTEIRIADCESQLGQAMFSLAVSGKIAERRMYHQAISQISSSPCIVQAYNLGLAP